MTLVSTYLLVFAYKNVNTVPQKREDAISEEVTGKLSEADNRKMSQKEKEERILWKKNEVADYEATTLSIFYNNTLLLDLVIVVSFFILKNFNPTVSYILSISASSGLIVLLAPSRPCQLSPLTLYLWVACGIQKSSRVVRVRGTQCFYSLELDDLKMQQKVIQYLFIGSF
jgi:hypothetical protein